MQAKNSYYYISADAFFKDLADMCANETPIRDKYAVMRNVFRVLVDQKLVDNRLAFTGLFAKVDYLIKESQMPFDMARRVNATRKILFPTLLLTENSQNRFRTTLRPCANSYLRYATALMCLWRCANSIPPQTGRLLGGDSTSGFNV